MTVAASTVAPVSGPHRRSAVRKRLSSLRRFLGGYAAWLRTGETSVEARLALAHLACATDCRVNDALATFSRLRHPRRRITPATGVLGDMCATSRTTVLRNLHQRGYHVFPQRLSAAACARILKFARVTPSEPWGDDAPAMPPRPFDERNPVAATYHFRDKAVLCGQADVQSILADPSLLAIAQAYLGSQPVLDLVTMWWSSARDGEADSKSAQLYHVDMPRLRFLKFFFYLVDVGPDNGPHCYVAGSHRRKPRAMRTYRRFTDQEIADHFDPDAIIELTGPQGTIIVADTRGLHKGKSLVRGSRLLLQLQFSTNLFGAPHETIKLNGTMSEALRRMRHRFPYVYQGFVD